MSTNPMTKLTFILIFSIAVAAVVKRAMHPLRDNMYLNALE